MIDTEEFTFTASSGELTSKIVGWIDEKGRYHMEVTTDTDIAALAERLRNPRDRDAIEDAVETLTAMQAELDGIRLDLNDCNNERVSWKARAEKAEAELKRLTPAR